MIRAFSGASSDRRMMICYGGIQNESNHTLVQFGCELVQKLKRDYSPVVVMREFMMLFLNYLQRYKRLCGAWRFVIYPFAFLITPALARKYLKTIVRSFNTSIILVPKAIKKRTFSVLRLLRGQYCFFVRQAWKCSSSFRKDMKCMQAFERRYLGRLFDSERFIESVLEDWFELLYDDDDIKNDYLYPLASLGLVTLMWHRWYVSGEDKPKYGWPHNSTSTRVLYDSQHVN